MKINLFTNWYKSYRDDENEACLMANMVNPLIDKIYLLCDDGKEVPEHEKVSVIKLDHRATYNDFFTAVNEFPQEIIIIANSDIYFDKSLEYLKYLKDDECYALTRWDDTLNGSIFYNRADSQDTWIFRGKVKEINGEFELGRLGCDNRIAYEIEKADYTIINPSKTIKIYHLHLEERTENSNHDKSKTIPPPYLYIKSTEILPFMSIVTRHYYKRPMMFKKCCESVSIQKDQDFDHVIITDNIGIGSERANGLFYSHKDQVKGKYVFMLDDDDFFTSEEFVGDIRKIAEEQNNPEVIFVRMMINDELYPTPMNWKKPKLYQNHIGTSCVVVRKDIWQKYIHNFTQIQIGDFNFINTVFLSTTKHYWQDKLYSKTGKVSHGESE